MEEKLLDGERRELCRIHSKRLTNIEDRQDRIYKSMFGLNGNPQDGYVWKLERVIEWIDGEYGIKKEWNGIKKTAMAGAWSAIVLVGSGALFCVGWVTWKMLQHLWGMK